MLSLSAKIREIQGKKVKTLRKEDILPAVLYGPKIQNQILEVELKEFERIYKEAGESTLISLEIENGSAQNLVLIHDVRRDPLTEKSIHVDFYQPSLDEEIEAQIPIILQGEAPAVKNLGGTLIKNISEIEVKALPQKLPREIIVSVEIIKTFEDNILVKDLKLADGVKILRDLEDVVAQVVPIEKVEEELEKPIEERPEEVEKVEVKKEEEGKEKPEEKKG